MCNSNKKIENKGHRIKILYTTPAIALFLLCVITSTLTWEKEDFGIGVCLMIFLCVIFTVFSIIAMIAMYREIGRFRAREFTRETDKTLYESEKNKKELEQVKTELEQVKKEKELLYNDSLYHICVDFRNAKAELEQSENELEQVEIKQQMLKEIKVIREKSQEVRKKINEINKQFSDTDETGTKVPNEG